MQILQLVLTVAFIAAPQLQLVTSSATDMDQVIDKISQEMRQNMRHIGEEMADVREEMNQELRHMREERRKELGELREGMSDQMDQIKGDEIREEIREEMKEEMRKKMRYIREEMKEELRHMREEMKEERRKELRELVESLREEMSDQIKGEINDMKAQISSPVDASFTAYSSEHKSYVVGDIIQFNGIIHNYGNNYDPVTGIFTCPMSGFYLFYVNLYSYDLIRAEIYVEGEGGLSEASAEVHGEWNHGSTLSVIWCDETQRVWVQCTWAGDLYGANTKTTVFSGTVLQYTNADIRPFYKLSD